MSIGRAECTQCILEVPECIRPEESGLHSERHNRGGPEQLTFKPSPQRILWIAGAGVDIAHFATIWHPRSGWGVHGIGPTWHRPCSRPGEPRGLHPEIPHQSATAEQSHEPSQRAAQLQCEQDVGSLRRSSQDVPGNHDDTPAAGSAR